MFIAIASDFMIFDDRNSGLKQSDVRPSLRASRQLSPELPSRAGRLGKEFGTNFYLIVMNGCTFLITLAVLCCWSGTAIALDPQKRITQYRLEVWQTIDGLPQNSIQAIVQTTDGYLWLGTKVGLVRFDGVRFTLFDKRNTKGMSPNPILALFAGKEGSLWIGTYGGGLTRFKDGKATTYSIKDGLVSNVVFSICETRNGALWIGTLDGLSQLKDGRFISYTTKDGLPDNKVNQVYEDREGNLWVCTDHGATRLKEGQFTTFTTKDGLFEHRVRSITEDHLGRYWISSGKGLSVLAGGSFSPYPARNAFLGKTISKTLVDRDGNLWVGVYGGGLARLSKGSFETYTSQNGLASDNVVAMYEDREGTLWIGTDGGGLIAIKDGKFTVYGVNEGLATDFVFSVIEGRHGGLWIGTNGGGLSYFNNGLFTNYATKIGLSNLRVVSLYEGRDGSIWFGTTSAGLNRLKEGKLSVFGDGEVQSVRAIHEDTAGGLWVGTYGGGLAHFKDGKFRKFGANEGLPSELVVVLHESWDASLWIGTERGGLSHFQNGKFTNFSVKDGLASNNVAAIHEDRDGALWIGTFDGGLSKYKDGRFTSYSIEQGLFADSIWGILEDDQNNLWMSSNKGIFSVSKLELNDIANGKVASIKSVTYDVFDGLRSGEVAGGNPAACKSGDGRLWFPTIKGLSVIDSYNLRINRVVPGVAIEQVLFDNKMVNETRLPPGKGEIEVHYTGLSFVAPTKVRFKYKLEGFDKDWIDAGTRRTAHYTNLPPGSYSFRVIAGNNDGVWNQTGASIQLYLQPHFYQTYTFLFSIAVFVLLIVLAAHRLRLRALNIRKKELEQLVDERTDDLLATTRQLKDANRRQADFVNGVSHELKTPLTLIKLYGETLLTGHEFPREERLRFYQIITRESERLSHLVDNVLDFSRIDRGLKRYIFHTGKIAPAVDAAISAYAEHLKRSGFTVDVNLASNLPALRFDSAAVAEVVLNLLDNAAKYSDQSKYISVRLRSGTSSIVLEVEDRGIGIPASEQERVFQQFYRGSNSGDKGGHGLGLFLVKHIMEAHGGAIELKSEPGKGTVCRLHFPLNGPGPA